MWSKDYYSSRNCLSGEMFKINGAGEIWFNSTSLSIFTISYYSIYSTTLEGLLFIMLSSISILSYWIGASYFLDGPKGSLHWGQSGFVNLSIFESTHIRMHSLWKMWEH